MPFRDVVPLEGVVPQGCDRIVGTVLVVGVDDHLDGGARFGGVGEDRVDLLPCGAHLLDFDDE